MTISAVRISASRPQAAVIFVHGLGDSGNGWSFLPQVLRPLGDHINYVFPNAPVTPVTANGGAAMPSWFDIYEFGNPAARQDEAGFFRACDTLKALVQEQVDLAVPPHKIVIGGFSQGAAVALATAALLDVKIGGVVGLSGFCPVAPQLPAKLAPDWPNRTTPVFQGHGSADPLINFRFGELTRDFYRSLGFTNLAFHAYDMGHSACDEELADVAQFLRPIIS